MTHDMEVTLQRNRKVISYETHQVTVVVTEAQIAAWAEKHGLDRDAMTSDEIIEIAADLHPVPADEWDVVEDDYTALATEGTVIPIERPNGIIIVDDGAYRWGADAAELLGYLTLRGWEIDGTRVTEPAGPGTDEHGNQLLGETPYDALCQDVLPLPGYDTTAACAAWNDLPSLTAWPSDGPRAWVLSGVSPAS